MAQSVRPGNDGSIPGRGKFLSQLRNRLRDPSQPSVQCLPVALALEVKRSGREADHSPTYSGEVVCLRGSIRIHGAMLSTKTTLHN
jgi:hypothetical protein